MIELLLSILLAVIVTGMGVWGSVISVKSLPENETHFRHIWIFVIGGILSLLMTIAIAVINHNSQEANDRKLSETSNSLKETLKLLNESRQAGEQSHLSEEYMKGQLETLGVVLSKFSIDSQSAIQSIGTALLANRETGASQNRYHSLTNKQLRDETLGVVSGILSLIGNDRNRDDALDAEYRNSNKRSAEWDIYTQKMMSISASTMTEYDQHYKVQAMLLRVELRTRENSANRNVPASANYIDSLYEHPTNPLGLEDVATDLERLARSLPEDEVKHHR